MISRKTLPHVVYCRIWRFADLQSSNELKSLPHCQYGYNHAHHHQTATTSSSSNNKLNDEQMVCINPYHYQRVECPTGGQQQQSQQHQPLTVYVPAKLQLSQQQSQQQQAAVGSSSTTQASVMDGIMSSVGQLIGVGGGSMQDELMSGVSASSFMHSSNMMRPINSPSPPSSASILSPSSIGIFISHFFFFKFGGLGF